MYKDYANTLEELENNSHLRVLRDFDTKDEKYI